MSKIPTLFWVAQDTYCNNRTTQDIILQKKKDECYSSNCNFIAFTFLCKSSISLNWDGFVQSS